MSSATQHINEAAEAMDAQVDVSANSRMVAEVEPLIVAPFHFFHVRVARIEQLSPNFRRIAFVGDGLSDWAHGGRDQRVKVLTPSPSGKLPLHLLNDADWWGKWREMPAEDKAPMRTYTGRAFNRAHETSHGADEIAVDFVLHGDGDGAGDGPASRWALNARVGDEAVLVGPSVRGGGRDGGIEWKPPASAKRIILAGDETAAPAICSIIDFAAREGLLAGRNPMDIRAFIEVPCDEDRLPCEFENHPQVKVTWLTRGEAPHGEHLDAAVRSTVTSRLVHECGLMCSGASCLTRAAGTAGAAGVLAGLRAELEDVDIESEILWDVQPQGEDATAAGCYAWIAGEAGVVKGLRRHLVTTLGMDRRSVAFMGYWRQGRAELS
ncbi:siderophore-interacting protein [Timonella senegalensis]|uniref:siderophore-interacting protein n=1 Tax=Timonella senegalensis TaxID=1465825 RepID=UPI000303E541|nr:siderophore-interacting protein [Timonella senegalensis]